MRSAAAPILLAAHQAEALHEIVRLVDDALAGRMTTRDALLDVRLRATTELTTRAEETHR